MGNDTALMTAELEEQAGEESSKKVRETINRGILGRGRDVILTEIDGLHSMCNKMDMTFVEAVRLILNCKGRVIICGMGKSGIIGNKIAATLASTGTKAYFLHPGEAFHGDLGMVDPSDLFIAISNSGETGELLQLLPFLRDNGNNIIAITNEPFSTLGKAATTVLELSIEREACIHQLAPSASTTATLAMGDALAITVMEQRGFEPKDFARFHPGGALGKRLLSTIESEMSTPVPFVSIDDTMVDTMMELNEINHGLVVVIQEEGVMGIITDGDIKRIFAKEGSAFGSALAGQHANTNYTSFDIDDNYGEAVATMEARNIKTAPIFGKDGLVVGILKI